MISVRPLTTEEHLEFVRTRPSVSFLQTPAWAAAKPEWQAESLGWFRAGAVVGAALVLYRQLPKVKRYLAYLPEGPVLDWEAEDLAGWLQPMVDHLKRQGAFGVRIGPPVVTRRWSAAQVKEGIADDAVRRLDDLAPLERSATGARVVAQLHELGWRQQAAEGGFAAGQPRYNFWIPLVSTGSTTPRSEDDVLKGMNQQWRRNIKKAAKEGVEVVSASPTAGPDLEAFHALYLHTAERDGFTPRPLSYFAAMHDALSAEDPDRIRLWFARHEGDVVAATIAIRVGTHAWYS
ncbi:MAG: lipid II:glycine glycyltransferase FemX, partial [Nocardioides sp.]